jgi:hypothetical protein
MVKNQYLTTGLLPETRDDYRAGSQTFENLFDKPARARKCKPSSTTNHLQKHHVIVNCVPLKLAVLHTILVAPLAHNNLFDFLLYCSGGQGGSFLYTVIRNSRLSFVCEKTNR